MTGAVLLQCPLSAKACRRLAPAAAPKSVDPGMPDKLAFKFGDTPLQSRRIDVAAQQDPHELAFERGWSDGLPVVPPTEERVLKMLDGTTRSPAEIVGVVPPDNIPCTVEKVAINAVLAGCKPEYLPVVLAAVEAACRDEFCMHGVLATTYFAAPILIVNGPVREKICMKLGQQCAGAGQSRKFNHRASIAVGHP